MYIAFDIAGNGGTDDGSPKDGANKGSDSAGHGGESDGMLLFVGCCIILNSFYSHIYLLKDLVVMAVVESLMV